VCIEIGSLENPIEIMGSQVKFIKLQQRDKVPSEAIKIRCPCLKLNNWAYMYRCLYCGIFYCKECAEEHFGKTVEQYRKGARDDG
jgi:hypothetical protein